MTHSLNSKAALKAYIRHAFDVQKGDDLERAEHAFRGMSPEQLARQYGYSGRTCQEILDDYRKHRALHNEALKYLEALFTLEEVTI